MSSRHFLFVILLFSLGSSGCDRSKSAAPECDRPGAAVRPELPMTLRLVIQFAQASTSTLSRERIEFQVDFLRTLKGGRTDEALYLAALAGSEARCAKEKPDPAFGACFQGFDFMHLKLTQKAIEPSSPDGLLPACAPHLFNCHDMAFTVDDQAGHVVKIELGHVCQYHEKYWIFGKLSCSRRQSDSNR